MFTAIVIAIASLWTYYITYKLNKLTVDIYSWQRAIQFYDYQNDKEILCSYSSESLTSNSDLFNSFKNLNSDFEYIATEGGIYSIPHKMTYVSLLNSFNNEKDLIFGLRLIGNDNLSLFSQKRILDIPMVIMGSDIFNIYVKYTVTNLDTGHNLDIKSVNDYEAFITSIYENKNNYSCKADYSTYKKVGKHDDGELISSFVLEIKIGPNFSNINYGKPYILETKYLNERAKNVR